MKDNVLVTNRILKFKAKKGNKFNQSVLFLLVLSSTLEIILT